MKTPHGNRALPIAVAAVALQALMILAFAWPAARIAPRDLPLVVAGPPGPAAAVAQKPASEHPGAFEITRLPDETAAAQAIKDRQAYGAVVVSSAGPRVLVASAASPIVAGFLTQAAQQMSGQPAAPVHDVATADRDDPRGAAFGAVLLPLIMSSIVAGVLLALLIPTASWRLAGLVTYGVGSGLVAAGMIQGWLSVLPGAYVTVASVTGLVALAVAAGVTGLAAVGGRAGIGLAALAMLLLGNPLSGVTSAPEMLPQPWGAIGQALPPGAGATLLRSVAFFDGARSGGALAVLLAWALGGLALVALGALRGRQARTAPIAVGTPAPAGSGS